MLESVCYLSGTQGACLQLPGISCSGLSHDSIRPAEFVETSGFKVGGGAMYN